MEMIVPHLNGEISFLHPAFGADTYKNVGQAILKAGLKVPTGDYMASLLHSAYCRKEVNNEPEFKNVKDIMRSNWLWVFNVNNWTDKGVYIIQDLKAEGRDMQLDLNQLERKLKGGKDFQGVRFSKDGRIRFAPKGSYTLGERTAKDLETDGFIIGSYGVEGAKKLAEVAYKFKNQPYLYGLEIVEGADSEKRVSALGGSGGVRLGVVGYWGVDYWCHSFWVRAPRKFLQ